MKTNLSIWVCLMVMLASCNTTYRSKSSDYQNITKSNIVQVPKIADFEVKPEKVSGEYSGLYKKKKHFTYLRVAKELALGNAISNAKCDFLIHPLYDIEIMGKKIYVNVTGYPANYTNFKTFELADTIYVQHQLVIPATTNVKVLSPISRIRR